MTAPKKRPPMLPGAEVAAELGVAPRAVLDRIHRGELAAVNVAKPDARRGGKRWRVTRRAFDRYLESNTLAA